MKEGGGRCVKSQEKERHLEDVSPPPLRALNGIFVESAVNQTNFMKKGSGLPLAIPSRSWS